MMDNVLLLFKISINFCIFSENVDNLNAEGFANFVCLKKLNEKYTKMAVLMSYHKLVERDSKHVDYCWKCEKNLEEFSNK